MTRINVTNGLFRRVRLRKNHPPIQQKHPLNVIGSEGREISSLSSSSSTALVHFDAYKHRQKQQHHQQLQRPYLIGINIIPTNGSSSTNQTFRYSSSSSSNMSTISHNSDNDKDNEEEEEIKRQRRKRTVQKIKESSAKIKPAAKKGASLLQQYGPVFLGTYFSIYFATLGSLWAGITYDVIDMEVIFYYLNKLGWHSVAVVEDGGGGDPGAIVDATANGAGSSGSSSAETEEANRAVKFVVSLLEEYEWTRPYAETAAKNSNVVNLGVAWVATKLTEPIRFGLTALILPSVARAVGRVPASSSSPSTLSEEEEGGENGKDLQDGVEKLFEEDISDKKAKIYEVDDSFEKQEGTLNDAMKKEEQDLMKP